jgi:hypothetical protein
MRVHSKHSLTLAYLSKNLKGEVLVNLNSKLSKIYPSISNNSYLV